MAFDFPNSPSEGQRYTPAGGPTYVYSGGVWKIEGSIGAPGNLSISDNPPPDPQAGQMWWESDSGNLFAYVNDGDSSQWVQINVPANNQVTRETFDLTGKTQQDIPVPVWGPSQARLSMVAQNSASISHGLRLSVDGTTFPAGATDYTFGGSVHYSGSAGYSVTALSTGGHWILCPPSDHTTIPVQIVVMAPLVRSSTGLFTFQSRSDSYNMAATNQYMTTHFHGYCTGLAAGTGNAKALRWICGSIVAGKLTVEWLP